MQMPPTNSVNSASTVAKIGRPMKKSTMIGLAAAPPIARRLEPAPFARPWPPGPFGRLERRILGLDVHARADQLKTFDDDELSRRQSRLDDPQPFVGFDRLDTGI